MTAACPRGIVVLALCVEALSRAGLACGAVTAFDPSALIGVERVRMFDFGGRQGSGSLGPGHADGTIEPGVSAWDYVPGFQEGTIPVGLEWGLESAVGSGIVVWTDVSGAALFESTFRTQVGSLFGNDVLGDSVLTGVNERGLAVRLDVEPGLYIAYVTAETSNPFTNRFTISIGSALPGAPSTDFTSFLSASLTNETYESFTLGVNYARFEFDVPDGESLVLVSRSDDPTGEAAFASVQLVAIPEPQVFAQLFVALASLALMRCRRRAYGQSPELNR